MATGERCPLKSRSETIPEISEPTTATMGTQVPKVQTARRFVLWVQFQHIVEIQHRQLSELLRTAPVTCRRRIKPHQWVVRRSKALGDTDPRHRSSQPRHE